MSPADFTALSPILCVAGTAVGVMLSIAVRRHHGVACGLTVLGLLAALRWALPEVPVQVTPLFTVDRYALFYIGLILATTLGVVLFSHGYLAQRTDRPEEYYLLLLLATVGACALVAASQFASFFLGLELLSMALFALIAYPESGRVPVEAALKYLILAGAASAFLLFGMALIYAQLGTLAFAAMRAVAPSAGSPLMDLGLSMVLIGVGFKLAIVPFHMWTPDVYQGAPAPVTAYVATVSKGALFALLLRYFLQTAAGSAIPVVTGLGWIAVASMLAGNWLALLQPDVKRVLAYSSIAHLGYLLVAFLALGALAIEAVTFYLVFYLATMLAAFGIVTVLSGTGADAGKQGLEAYHGLFWRQPWLAASFTVVLLALAGIPLTLGFLAKFYVIVAAADRASWGLIGALVVGSAIGLYYYLRIVVVMYREPVGAQTVVVPPWPARLALIALTVFLVGFGIYPRPVIGLVQAAIGPEQAVWLVPGR